MLRAVRFCEYSFPRGRSAFVAALFATLVLWSPAGAHALDSLPGDYGYGLSGCVSSDAGYGGYGAAGKCDAVRPRVTISAAPATPRAGAPVHLSAAVRGQAGGLTTTWDLDGDGQYDDTPAGVDDPAQITHVFSAAGTVEIGVRVVNDEGQSATERRTLVVHATNYAPAASIVAYPTAPRTGQPVTLTRYADDRDGEVTTTAWDLDGDGTFETPGTGSSVKTTFASAGEKTVGVRVTDDGGASATATATLIVHQDNLEPYVQLSTYPSVVRPGAQVSVSASGTDPDGSIASYAFDLDGDGTYETSAGSYVTTSFATDGTYVVGVRVVDNDGAVTTMRRSVQVTSANVPPTVSLSQTLSGPTSVTFTAYGYDPDSNYYGQLQYAWDLNGDDVYDDLVGVGASVATLPTPGAGTYEVGVRVTDADGATATRRSVVVRSAGPPPAPTIYTSPGQPRAGQQVSVSGYVSTAFGDVQYAWDVDDDGQFDDGASAYLSTTFGSSGPHNVAVRVTSALGQTVVSRSIVNVSPAVGDLVPNPTLYTSPQLPRAGESTYLNVYQSGGGFADAAWDLDGDGQFDDASSAYVSHVFPAAGSYEIAARVTDGLGATAVQRRTVVVHDGNLPPLATISASPDAGTVGQTVTLYGSADGQDDSIQAYAWDLDDDGQFDDSTSSNPTVQLSAPGTLRVRLRVTDAGGATAVAVRPIVVRAAEPNRAPRVEISQSGSALRPNIGASLWAYVTEPDGDPVTYAWDLDGDGQFNDGGSSTVVASFPSPGTPTVRVRVSDGRGGVTVAERTLQVRAVNLPPVIEYWSTIPAAPRVGRPVYLYNWAYDPDGQSVTLTYDLDGDGEYDDTPGGVSYSRTWTPTSTAPVTIGIRATDVEGASTTRRMQVTPRAENLPPVVWLANRSAAATGEVLNVHAYTSDADGVQPDVAWDLDADGQFDDATGPDAAVLMPSTSVTVGVRATDDEGATAVVRQTFRPNGVPPTATFTASDLAPKQNQNVTFTATAVPGDSAITARRWDLDGDGQFDDATGAVATQSFSVAGDALVGLEVVDADGDRGVTYQVVKVVSLTAPVASFTMSPDHPGTGQTITFTSTATDPQGAGTIVSRQWDLDADGEYDDASGAVVTTSYAQAGYKRVRLKVTDAGGETSTAVVFFRVAGNASPVASFTRTPLVPVTGQQVTFTSTSTDSDGTIAALAWDLDNDGQFDDGSAASATAAYAAGSRTVRLKVTDDKGATDIETQTFTVLSGAPTASFTVSPSPPRAGQTATFSSTSTDIDGTVVAQAWDLDDDGQFDDGTAVTATRTFALPGDYVVRLKVTDDDGKTDTSVRTVRVRTNVPPTLSLSTSKPTPRPGETVNFSALTGDPDGLSPVSVSWDLDDDGQFDDATGLAASRSFPAAGSFSVRARAQDAEGGITVEQATVKVSAGNQAPVLYAYADDDARRRGDAGAAFTFSAYAWDPDDSTYSAGGNSDGIALWEWDLNGDGDYTDPEDRSGSSLKSVQVTLGAGLSGTVTHTVHVRVRDPFSPAATAEQTLTVSTYDANKPPVASIYHYPWSVQRNVANTYVAQAADPDGDHIASYAWDLDGDGQFDDGNTASVQWAFATLGTRTIKVRVRDDAQPAAETVASYAVDVTGALPTARWTATPYAPNTGEPVTLTSTSTDPDGTIASTGWDLDGDGTYDDATGITVSRSFPAGTTTVSLRVADDDGNVAIRTGQVVVHAPIQKPGGGDAGVGTPQPQPTTKDGEPLDGGIATRVDPDTGRVEVSVGRGLLGVNGGCVGMDLTFPVKGAANDVRLIVRRSGAPDQAIVAAPVLDAQQQPTGQWRAHVECISTAALLVEYDLPNPQGGADDHIGPVPVGGITLIDPQGVVYDRSAYDTALAAKGVSDATATDDQKRDARAKAAIEGAKVTLQRLVSGQWKTVNPDDPGISPNVNPQTTGADGLYKWDVSAGSYRVIVARPGYDTVTSDAAVIPPPKLDLHVPMERNAAPVARFAVEGDAVAGAPVTLSSSSSVLNGVLQAQEWDLDDDGQFDDRAGDRVGWTFTSAGQHRVRLRVRDADGEVDVATKTITVVAPQSRGPDGDGSGPGAPAAAAAARDTTPPRATLKIARTTIRKAFAKGLPITLTCSEACSATITVNVDRKTARRLRLKGTQLARVSRTCAPGRPATLALRLSSKARAAARRLSRLKLSVSVVALDAAGNQRVVTTPVTLRR